MNQNSLTYPTISVVIPVYGCLICLDALCEQVEASVSRLTPNFEIILVDDGSPDCWWQYLPKLQERYASVKGVRLSRNYGQQIAVTAGLAQAKGDYAVVMDCDLQDSPSLIPKLYAKLQEGYDLVLAKRVQRNHSGFRRLAAKLYFALLSKLADEPIDGSYGSFSILSRKVIDSFLLFKERERHYLFILRWLGFSVGSIDIVHQKRHSGKSSYTLKSLVYLALDGVLFQTSVMLTWITGLGFISAFFSIVSAIYLVFQYLYRDILPGWTSLIVLILGSTGVLLISLGVIGLYIGRIFDQTKQRPLYVIDTIQERKLPW